MTRHSQADDVQERFILVTEADSMAETTTSRHEPILAGGTSTNPSRMSTGFTIWLTGLSGSGKSTIAAILEVRLRERALRVEVLDGDVVRTHLSKGLGFSKEDRDTNIRRIGWICELLSRNDVVAIASVISPYRDVRDEVRSHIGRFVEVYVQAPLDLLKRRDVKGLYRRAMAGEIPSFTGISDDYEAPLDPEVTCHSDGRDTPAESAAKVITTLEELGYLGRT